MESPKGKPLESTVGESKPAANHFALLIGVNSDSERPLKGCVRDVREISKCIDKSMTGVHIQLFTAEDPSAEAEDTAHAESLATYSNINAGLRTILSIAKPGSYVYIHYSGHGVRMEASSEFSSRETGDLALNVLEETSQTVTRPFPSLELAQVLKTMVSKSLFVTLVLDCCFSGSVLRDAVPYDSLVRYREYLPMSYDMSAWLHGEADVRTDSPEIHDDEDRDVSMLPNWLVDPKGYTILTACGPHEVALELNLGGEASKHRHGALSYFLLRAMKKLGGLGGKHAHIYPYLCSLFRQFQPKQNPMWYGNKDLYFFGDTTLSSDLTGSPFAVAWSGDFLQLQGGHAHGICEGDQFVIYTISSERPLVIGTVKRLRALTSSLEVADPASIRHEKGCIARALTHQSLKRYPIQLRLNSPYSEEWQAAMEERQYLAFQDDQHPFALQIFADESHDVYRIRDDGSGKETECSSVSMGSEDLVMSPSRVLDICERMAKYRFVKDLINRSDNVAFGGLYRVSITDRAGATFQPGSIINGRDRSRLFLTIENTGTADIYVHIYNLGPLGQVKNIQSASYSVVPPRNLPEGFTGELTKKFRLEVPSMLAQRGFSSCEDTIKVLLTSIPTSFASLEMPSLGDSHDRGDVEPVDGYGVSLEREDWVALSFTIRTFQDLGFAS